MKVYRYMSLNEFNKMAAGCEIIGRKSFRAYTESKGICFLPESVRFESESVDWDTLESEFQEVCFSPADCLRFLSGIVTDEVLVEFEAAEGYLSESRAFSSDPVNLDPDATIEITELCAPSYNRNIFQPLRYGFVDRWTGGAEWYYFN